MPTLLEYEQKLKHLEARFRIVTPCFVGSGDDDAELRVPSIKGVLRFWWRALKWAQFAKDGGAEVGIRRMKRREQKLFGSSDEGQSRFLMRIETDKRCDVYNRDKILQLGSGARYLGYGVMEACGSEKKGAESARLTRPCLIAPFDFMLRINARKQAELDDVLPALKLLGLVGGLGARSRKGYGSLNLISLEGDDVTDWRTPTTLEQYRKSLGSLLLDAKAVNQKPEFSAFSSHACIGLIPSSKDEPLEVIDNYGRAMANYRSPGQQASKQQKENFRRQLSVFGLPKKYGKDKEITPRNLKRRASPLFFHVHELDGKYEGVVLILRSRFLPKNEKMNFNGQLIPADVDWRILTDFLSDRCRIQRLWPDA